MPTNLTVLLLVVLGLAVLFDYINGFHDTANAIATSVSTRALKPEHAILMSATANFVGALTGTAVAKTISQGLATTPDGSAGQTIVAAALVGSRAEIGGRPVSIARESLARPGQDHRQLPGTQHEQDGQRGDVQPAPHRRAEQARHVTPGQHATDDRQPELQAPDRRIEQAVGRRAERLLVHDQVSEPGPDHGPGDDPDRHERDVVGPQVIGTGEKSGQDQGRDDDADERDRPPAHGQVAEQLDVGVEVEGQDGDRHGGDECIEGRRQGTALACAHRRRPSDLSSRRHADCQPMARRYVTPRTSSAQAVGRTRGRVICARRRTSLGALTLGRPPAATCGFLVATPRRSSRCSS